MKVEVLHCEWEDAHPEGVGCICYPAVIRWDHAACHNGMPVVEINGEVLGPGELPPGELSVPEEVSDALRRAGYPVTLLSDQEREQFWDKGVPVDHWHPEARLIRF